MYPAAATTRWPGVGRFTSGKPGTSSTTCELSRWHAQARGRDGQRDGGRCRLSATAEAAARLADTVARLRVEPDGPRLYALNDEANAMLRELPVLHVVRRRVLEQALELPGREGYYYFGRCATLPYVQEAFAEAKAAKRDRAAPSSSDAVDRSSLEHVVDATTSLPVPPVQQVRPSHCRLLCALMLRSRYGDSRSVAFREAAYAAVTAQEMRQARHAARLEAQAQAAAVWRERLAAAETTMAKRQRLEDDVESDAHGVGGDRASSSHKGQEPLRDAKSSLGALDPLAYLDSDEEDES